jgi:hypothetical protein
VTIINKARCKARAVPDTHAYGYANSGTEQVGFRVECLDGIFQNETFTWYGYFTENTEQRTIEQLMIAGWSGEDALNLPGLGSTEFELQLEEEQEVDEHGQPAGTRWRPTFINKISVAMRNQMDEMQKRSFAARLNAVARNVKGGAAPQRGAAAPQRGPAPQRQPGRAPNPAPAGRALPAGAGDYETPPDDELGF